MTPNSKAPGTITRVARQTQGVPVTNALVAGTRLLTLDGVLPVEFLSPGDRVITRDAGMALLREVVIRKLFCDAVKVGAGTLWNQRPDRDVLFPASQQILVRDWRACGMFGCAQALVTFRQLADGVCVRNIGKVRLTLVELTFDAPHIIYADGLEVAAREPVHEPV